MTEPSTAAAPHPTAATGAAYNPFDPAYARDPYAFYAIARRDAPVCYSPLFDLWLVTGRHEITTVLKDPLLYSSASNLNLPFALPPEVEAVLDEGDHPMASSLFNSDPPSHTRARVLATSALSPARIAALEPVIRALAHRLVDAFAGDGHAELLTQFAYPLPMTIIADLIGVPRADMAQIKIWHDDWMKLFVPGLPLPEQLACARSIVAYQRYYSDLIAERRARPQADLITALVEARIDGEPPFTTREMVSQLLLILSAGHETTTNLIGHLVYLLLADPERWRAVAADRSLIPTVIEEALRFETPATMEPRTTTAATELSGVAIPKGARLHVFYGAINRDPALFDEPDRFDMRRQNLQRHMAFGYGIHFCLGAALARLEGRVALEVLLERLPALRLAPGFSLEYLPSFFFRQPKQLDVVWDR